LCAAKIVRRVSKIVRCGSKIVRRASKIVCCASKIVCCASKIVCCASKIVESCAPLLKNRASRPNKALPPGLQQKSRSPGGNTFFGLCGSCPIWHYHHSCEIFAAALVVIPYSDGSHNFVLLIVVIAVTFTISCGKWLI
jgi:hypothetical protein